MNFMTFFRHLYGTSQAFQVVERLIDEGADHLATASSLNYIMYFCNTFHLDCPLMVQDRFPEESFGCRSFEWNGGMGFQCFVLGQVHVVKKGFCFRRGLGS